MINLAVIDIKDIIKYLIKITIIITIVVILTKYFSSFKTKLKDAQNTSSGYTFLACLDIQIPGIKNINKKAEIKSNVGDVGPLKQALEIELGMMGSLANNSEENTNLEEQKKETKEEVLEEAKTGLTTEVDESNVPQTYTMTYNGVKIKNETKNKITDDMLKQAVKLNMKNIIIYHTHSCESYTPSEKYTYKKSGNFRTTDKERSVIKVGTELEKYMKNYGYNVANDTNYYDYPAYNGSYARSLSGVSKVLAQNKGTEIFFDIHRDAIGDSSYAPSVKIGNETAAQLLFVIGGNASGNHENWIENLRFAVQIQAKANELYPGLFKPIIVRNSTYNQNLGKGAAIIEVGATGNTLDQCLVSMKYLSKVLSEVLK